MKRLITIDETTFGSVSKRGVADYRQRRAVRAVVLDDEQRVYMMHVGSKDVYKLPGGGIDQGEDNHTALARELMEEVGVRIEIIDEIGEVVEYRDEHMLEQISYCYLARQVGDKVPNSLEADEIAKGMYEIQVDSIDHAIELVEASLPSAGDSSFMHLREQTILQAAKQLIDRLPSPALADRPGR